METEVRGRGRINGGGGVVRTIQIFPLENFDFSLKTEEF